MKIRIAALAALSLACALPAHAQPDDRRGGWNGGWNGGRSGAITLYSGPDFRGAEFSSTTEYSNLPRRLNDQAMSLRVEGGAWEVCSDANFRGRCQIVTRGVRNLGELGLAQAISSMRPADRRDDWNDGRPGPGGGWNGGGWNGGRGSSITLFGAPGFSGPAYSTNQETSNLPRRDNDRAMSLRIDGRGAWEVCADADFRGRCQVFTRDVPDLRQYGLGEAISSVRPARY